MQSNITLLESHNVSPDHIRLGLHITMRVVITWTFPLRFNRFRVEGLLRHVLLPRPSAQRSSGLIAWNGGPLALARALCSEAERRLAAKRCEVKVVPAGRRPRRSVRRRPRTRGPHGSDQVSSRSDRKGQKRACAAEVWGGSDTPTTTRWAPTPGGDEVCRATQCHAVTYRPALGRECR